LSMLDLLAPSLALGLAFGRMGCFMSGCCWGDLCVQPQQLVELSATQRLQVQTFPSLSPATMPLAVQFPPTSGAFEQHHKLGLVSHHEQKSLPVHPTQLYEVLMALTLCVVLNTRFKRKMHNGDILWFAGLGYSVMRFSVEFFRAESPQIYFGSLTFSQMVSLWIAVCSIVGFCLVRVIYRLQLAEQPKVAE
ncbi:MAG: prolipoprotein diacylglyceryl transferase, partial [Limisphaerales bacterium]